MSQIPHSIFLPSMTLYMPLSSARDILLCIIIVENSHLSFWLSLNFILPVKIPRPVPGRIHFLFYERKRNLNTYSVHIIQIHIFEEIITCIHSSYCTCCISHLWFNIVFKCNWNVLQLSTVSNWIYCTFLFIWTTSYSEIKYHGLKNLCFCMQTN